MSTRSQTFQTRVSSVGGIVASLVTPFDESGELAIDDYRAQTLRIAKAGISSFCIAGGTGEYHALSKEEYGKAIRLTREDHPDSTIVVGAFELDPSEVIARLAYAKDCGADVGMIIAPPFVNLDEEQLVMYLQQVFDATPLPVILFETRTRTRSALSVEALLKLAAERPAFVGVKDSYGELSRFETLIQRSPDGFGILQGRDDLVFTSLCLGADGSLNSFGAVAPFTCSRLLACVRTGDLDGARKLHRKVTAWSKSIYKWTSPVGIKAVMQLNNQAKAVVRAPLSTLAGADLDELRAVASDIDKLERELARAGSSIEESN